MKAYQTLPHLPYSKLQEKQSVTSSHSICQRAKTNNIQLLLQPHRPESERRSLNSRPSTPPSTVAFGFQSVQKRKFEKKN